MWVQYLFVNYSMSKYTTDILSEIRQTDRIIPPAYDSDSYDKVSFGKVKYDFVLLSFIFEIEC